jgi:hypothetical protein
MLRGSCGGGKEGEAGKIGARGLKGRMHLKRLGKWRLESGWKQAGKWLAVLPAIFLRSVNQEGLDGGPAGPSRAALAEAGRGF